MSEILANLRDKLEKTEQIEQQRDKLNAEQAELQSKIQTLTAAVAGGDAKSVTALTIAKARLEVLPGDLARNQAEFDDCIEELRGGLGSVQILVANAYRRERDRVEQAAKEFLGTHLERPANAHLIEDLARQITNAAKTVMEMEALTNFYGSLQIRSISTPNNIISRARSALDRLQNV